MLFVSDLSLNKMMISIDGSLVLCKREGYGCDPSKPGPAANMPMFFSKVRRVS
jgi:hypothetical protein